MKNVGLIPLWNFGEIAPHLYRSAQPLYGFQYDWLRKNLGVVQIVNLRQESRHDNNHAGDNQVVVNFDVKDHFPPTIEQANNFMQLIRDNVDLRPDGLDVVGVRTPMLIHCEHGHGRTSTFSILAKLALGETLDAAIKDEKERFHFEFRHHAQEDWLRGNFGQC